MGHGNSDKLYITHSEHAGLYGSHSASTGFKTKAQESPPGTRTPYDCCALSLQPFTHPVCARNSDGTGTVFDLIHIIPWLKQHSNTHPITKAPLEPTDLITLHYSRKEASGEIHDPISFKPFSEHSHIVAVAITGNVYLAESVKGGRDLLADIPVKKSDLITLQNPHDLPSVSAPLLASSSNALPNTIPKSSATARPTSTAGPTSKEKAPVPWNISPYSSGLPGASLTSTSVDPHTATSQLLWDEEELMFEEFSNPPKGKGKEKDVGRRRAYVRIITTLGNGSLNLELYCEKAPKTCYNFLMLAKAGKYNNCLFHRLVPGFMIQTGDPSGTGAGGESHWGTPFRDEYDLKGAAKHESRGILAMANKGPGTNGSQFYFTFRATPHLDKKHTVFGKLVGGEEVLDALEKLPLKQGTERPAKPVRIQEIIIYQDPFEEYKKRHAKKIAKRSEPVQKVMEEKKDDMNWFGEKLNSAQFIIDSGTDSGGVGKYLNLKRGPELVAGASADEGKKKRKLGFGEFEGW
ncbi:hypothetical protein AMATHDRAFT_44574 [Amanita thiersii Skay4041]|uniref:Peptidylprolyl isomerase n=1 Tax=Amanita thiersii Skay4041 TaxID=703135 RepID=A0A2A9NUW0_9AGAR|nr:hypothetical protein AMATHDRAFT_44574 [Amanita thiersii Skay4041]